MWRRHSQPSQGQRIHPEIEKIEEGRREGEGMERPTWDNLKICFFLSTILRVPSVVHLNQSIPFIPSSSLPSNISGMQPSLSIQSLSSLFSILIVSLNRQPLSIIKVSIRYREYGCSLDANFSSIFICFVVHIRNIFQFDLNSRDGNSHVTGIRITSNRQLKWRDEYGSVSFY